MASPENKDMERGQWGAGNEVFAPICSRHTTGGTERPSNSPDPSGKLGKFEVYMTKFERQLIKYNLEARGMQQVEAHECHKKSWKNLVQAFFLWVSINLAAVNITLGMLAPTVFTLSFKDASLCAAFGSLLGSLAPAYISTWGPVSGNRTMIFTRYTFGWWPSKLIVVLNLILLLGYSLIDLVVAGQILSAISSNGSLSVVVGIIIVAITSWVVSTFGIRFFHIYMRYAWLPQVVAVSILYAVSASRYDLQTPTTGDPRTRVGDRLSFFSLCLSAAITYAGGAADFFVYFPRNTPRLPLFAVSLVSLGSSFTLAIIVGIGLASAIPKNGAYAVAYENGQGALLVEGYSSLGGFGKFLGVVIALGLIANTVAPTYSCGIDFQILGRQAQRVPRFIWNTMSVIIYLVCALAGRNNLSEIFTNFLALMGYWVAIWIAITLEEQIVFRRKTGYDWTIWNQKDKLPVGIAASIAFLGGWAGAILCMAQVWYTGPIAKTVGEYGGDVSCNRFTLFSSYMFGFFA